MKERIYRICPGLFWVNDRHFVTVVDSVNAASHSLEAEWAVLWRMLQQELPLDEIIRLYAGLFSISKPDALAEIDRTLSQMATLGFVEVVDG